MPIILDQIKRLADSKWSGIPGSVAVCVGLDLHSTPGLLKVHQKLTKDSGATVDAFARIAVAASNGYTFWFSYTTGKIWARSSAGTWSLAYTTVATGDDFCVGAMEYNGFIYWATPSRLHRVTIAGADDSWTAGAVSLDWATFAVTDAGFHPMAIQNAILFIGDGYQVASVNGSATFNNNALDIKTPHRIKDMIAYELDILIGTLVATTVNKAEVLRWDTVSPSWTSSDPIEEVGINSFIRDDNYVYAQAGRAGNLYFYNGEQLEPYKRIPGDFSNVKYGEVYPGSVGNFRGIPIFGFSNSPESGNSTGNPANQGVYSFGSYSRDYPKVMDLSFVISEAVLSGIEIGAILVVDFDVFVAWKNGSTFGVDKIDYTAKYASAYFETRLLFQDQRDISKSLARVYSLYETLPSGTSITFSYKTNHGSYVDMTSVTDSTNNEVYAELDVSDTGALQVKVAFGVSSNDAPTLEIPLGVEINA